MSRVPEQFRPFLKYALISFGVVLVLGFHKDAAGGYKWHFAWHEGLIAIATAAAVAFVERAFMFRHVLENISKTVESGLDKALPLTKQAAEFGLVRIHSGFENAAKDLVLQAVRSATDRVYVLAIAGRRPIDVQDILTACRDQESRRCRVPNCKILLANPFRGGAIFRSFLSASEQELAKLVDEARAAHEQSKSPGPNSAILRRTIPKYARALRERLDSDFDQFQGSVRYYASDSQLWIVIADDTVFVKNMTFSRASDGIGEKDRSHSSHTPIFEYRGTAATDIVQAYTRHIEELWRSATDDWEWIEARYEQQDALYKKFFRDRWPWIRHAFSNKSRQYRHKFIRDLDWPEVKLKLGQAPAVVATVLDASPGGLGIRVASLPTGWDKDVVLSLADVTTHQSLASDPHKSRLSTENAKLLLRTCQKFGIVGFRIVETPKTDGSGFHVSLESVRQQ